MNIHPWVRRINSFLGALISIQFTLLLIVVLWQVLSRYVLNHPSTFTEELSRFLLMGLALFGAVYVYGEKGHLAIDLLKTKLSDTGKKNIEQLYCFLISIFSIILLIGGIEISKNALFLNQMTPTLNIPMAWVYFVVPFSASLLLIYSILFFWETLKWNSQL